MKYPEPEKPKQRFPRTKNVIAIYMAELRVKYPPPEYNPHYDGSMNPADMVLQSFMKVTKKKLRKWCRKHSLKDTGNRRKMIKRLYLHWRASKMGMGDPQIGYGKGYECTEPPRCVCGARRRSDFILYEKRKEQEREMRRKQRRRADELWTRAFNKNYHRRFPRLRFPRFKNPEDAKIYYKDFDRMLL
jgi:hypothetical protein